MKLSRANFSPRPKRFHCSLYALDHLIAFDSIGIMAGFLLALFSCASADACSIPVFRYALDRWPADRYRLELSADDRKDEGVARFRRNFTDSTPINVEFALLPEGADDSSRALFPHPEPGATPAWTGKLDAATLAQLTESPARKEIIRRILSGESAVWVLVESGDSHADDATAATIEKRLRYLEQIAQLPVIDPNDPSSKLGPGPALAVKFSLLRVNAGDPAEQAFLTMLAGPEPSRGLRDGAWVSAVFGRGRALGAWPAAEVGDEQIEEVCLFLLGACSCQVKRENPGWDLLLDADWNEQLTAMGFPATMASEETPMNAVPTPPQPAAIETATFTPAAQLSAEAAAPAASSSPWLLAGTAAALLALAAFFGLSSRKSL